MVRPRVRGAAVRRERADPLRAVAARRVPLPRRALRELVDSGLGHARRAARRARRGGRDAARQASERRLLPGRSARDDRPRREERDPDRRVREGPRGAGQDADRSRDRGGADAPAADPDDVARVRARRVAARDRARCRCRRAERDRHRRHRWRARGDVPRRLARAGVLRADRSARRSRPRSRRRSQRGRMRKLVASRSLVARRLHARADVRAAGRAGRERFAAGGGVSRPPIRAGARCSAIRGCRR